MHHHPRDILTPKQAQAEEQVMGDFWASSAHSSKLFSARPTSGNKMLLDNLGADDDDDYARSYFTCPFCYVDVELSVLCDHLQDEHCFDVKNAVCPLCALTLGKDVAGHFRVHHATSIKTQKRSQKSGFWSFYSGRSLHGGLGAKNGFDNVDPSAPDPLLSPFLFSSPYSGTKGNQSQDLFPHNDVSSIVEAKSSKPSVRNQTEPKGNSEEMRQRAEFCQQLMYSTIL